MSLPSSGDKACLDPWTKKPEPGNKQHHINVLFISFSNDGQSVGLCTDLKLKPHYRKRAVPHKIPFWVSQVVAIK